MSNKKVIKDIDAVKSILNEFKSFIARGNVVDLAVGVVIGGAFGKIVTSLVNDIIMPLIGVLLGGLNFSALSIKVGSASVTYGNFIQNIIDFSIIAASIFLFVKLINKISRRQDSDTKDTKKEDEQLVVLREIRDQLKKSAKNK